MKIDDLNSLKKKANFETVYPKTIPNKTTQQKKLVSWVEFLDEEYLNIGLSELSLKTPNQLPLKTVTNLTPAKRLRDVDYKGL